MRLPTLEIFAVLHGEAFASSSRSLTAREVELARPIFGASVAFERVRVVEAWFANAPTTLGDAIRIDRRAGLDDATLIHELAHVWQFQTRGTGYITNSLCHQLAGVLLEGDRNAAYRLTWEDIRRTRSIYDLTAEKQAMFVQLYFMWPELRRDEHAQQLIDEIRRARPNAPSLLLEEAAWGPGRPSPLDDPTREQPHVVPLFRVDF